MIDWSAEQSDKFIGTTAAILSAIAAGAAATGGITAAHMASSGAKDSAKIQADAATHAAELQDAAAQRAETFSRQQAENQWQNAQQVQRANYDQAKARYGTISGVASQYGLNVGAMPDYAAGIDPHYDLGQTAVPGTVNGAAAAPASPASGSSPSAFLKGLLDSGMDPQQAAQKTNSQFNLQTGAQAQYYAPSAQTSGKAVIGLPDAYLSQEPSGWSLTTRSAAAAPKAGTIAAASPYMAPPTMSAPAVNTAIPTPYQPGTIGSYGRMR